MIRFSHPELAYLFIPWAVLFVWIHWQQARMRRRLKALGGERVRYYVLGRIRFQRQATKLSLFFLALGLLIVSAIGPKVGTRVVELKHQGVDVVFILDTSVSMDAEDVKPSRLEKAKYEVSRLISGLKGDRVGLIVFAGTAHLHFPLTSDYAAARLFLNAVDTRLVQVQGTVIADALELAVNTFDSETEKYKAVVLLSDGEDHDGRALQLAGQAAETGIIIHTVGIGSPQGAPIPIEGGQDFKKDQQGRVVTSILNEPMMRELAQVGKGTYTRVDNRSGDLSGLLEAIQNMEQRTIKTHEFTQFEDRYQLFAFPALMVFLFEILLPGGRKETPKARSRYV